MRKEELQGGQEKKRGRLSLGKIVLWIVFFPLMAGIAVWRSKKLKPSIKIVLTVVIVIAVLAFWESGSSEAPVVQETQQVNQQSDQQAAVQKQEQIQTVESSEDTQEEPQEMEAGDANAEIIRPEVKQYIDDYEQFIYDYCDFLEVYDSTNLADLLKFTEISLEYAEKAEAFSKLDTGDFNEAETYYLAEASLRIEKRLLEVAYLMNG